MPVTRADHAAWEPARWGRLLDVADWHRLSPVMYTYLRSAGGAPAAVLSALERAYLANAARSLYLREATARVVLQLEEAGVATLLLKGAALVETAYEDPAEREMLDIDVLVPRPHMEAATAAVTALGYQTRPDPDRVSSPEAGGPADDSGSHHDAALVDPESLVAVELHRHIATGEEGRFGLNDLWQRARPAERTGHLVPAPEDLLIHVCFHFTRNRLGGSAHRRNTGGALAQILDMRRVVGCNTIDWELLTSTAQRYRLGTRVFLALFAAQELGVPIPHRELDAIRPDGFDDELGRRLVQLRVLRAGDHLPVRSMRWMFAPSREALRRGWNADPTATLSLARAYMRRAKAHLPEARAAAGRPWIYLQDRKLNGHIDALRERA